MGGLELMTVPAVAYVLYFRIFGTVQIVPNVSVASAIEAVRAFSFSIFGLFQGAPFCSDHSIAYGH